jgi:CRP/FNR family transcriptional regulator
MKRFQKGQTIFSPGSPSKVFIVKSGQVDLHYINPEGKKIIIDTLRPGSIFSTPSEKLTSDLDIEASKDSYICWVDRDEFISLISSYPYISAQFINHLFTRLSQAEQKIASLAGDNALDKLKKLLLRLGRQYGRPQGDTLIFTQRFTHEQLSQMLGISRQTLTTFLNQLEKDGYLNKQDKLLTLNTSKLQEATL